DAFGVVCKDDCVNAGYHGGASLVTVELPQEMRDQLQFRDAVGVVELGACCRLEARELGEELTLDARGGRGDDDLPPGRGVELAPNKSGFLQPVDQSGDRAGGEAGHLGEPSCRGRPVEKDQAQGADVRRVESDLLRCLEVRSEQLAHEAAQVELELANDG